MCIRDSFNTFIYDSEKRPLSKDIDRYILLPNGKRYLYSNYIDVAEDVSYGVNAESGSHVKPHENPLSSRVLFVMGPIDAEKIHWVADDAKQGFYNVTGLEVDDVSAALK